MLREKLAANVFAFRKYNKLTQKDLCKISKVDRMQIGNIENMRTSTGIDIIEKIAIGLNIDPCILLSRPILKIPKTGIKSVKIIPTYLKEGVCAYAFWTSEGMEFHPISQNSWRNALTMISLIQANGFTGDKLLDESNKLHIPYKKLLR